MAPPAPTTAPARTPRPARPRPPWGCAATLGLLGIGAALGLPRLATWRAAGETSDAAFEAHLATLAERFEALPPLTAAEAGTLAQPRNADHLRAARRLGIAPVAAFDRLDAVADSLGLVLLPEASATVLATRGTYSRPRLVPAAAALVDTLGAAFRDSLRARGLPDVRLVLTSALRATDSQRALAEVNAAATRGTSAHTFATTFDLTYRRFPLAAPGAALAPPPDPRLPGPLRAALAARHDAALADTLSALAAGHADGLDALLGRTLLAQQRQGRLLTLRERTQPVYHATLTADPREP